VEGNETFKGIVKPLFYTENKSRFSKYNDKIIVIKNNSVEYNKLTKTDGSFTREHFSRDLINEELIKINLDENDIILHGDLDEIPNPKFLNLLKKNKYNFTFLSIKMQLYYYNFEIPYLVKRLVH
jgi:beta-1,4-mannosyl-glycoprotein beta-1,4-N-acetylglucosaminyltransferase